jgi:hypothetical protein
MQSAFHVQSTFLDAAFNHCWTSSHRTLELYHAETTTSASQAYLQATPVEQFPENHDIVEQSVR